MWNPYAQKLYDKKYRRKNKKIIKEKRRLRYLKNREKEIAKVKEYKAKNMEKVLADQKIWYQQRKLKEAKRYLSKFKYELRNPDRCKIYYQNKKLNKL